MANRTYKVEGMRVLLPSEKTAKENPDLAFNVVGKFSTEDGRELSFKSKAITTDMLPHVTVNLAKGILTVPAGTRGAPKRESADQSTIDALLSQARGK